MKALGSFGSALGGMVAGANGGTAQGGMPSGPVVRVARGNSVTYVPVGAN